MMTRWEYTSVNVAPGESWYDTLRVKGREGWEAWHIEKANGWREIHFKRPIARWAISGSEIDALR